MNENERTQTQSAAATDGSSKEQGQAPYESVVSQVVAKIKKEPFLFVIAIAALIIGLVVLATGLGSPDLRFSVVVIASLAFVVILGNYVLEVVRVRSEARPTAPAPTPAPTPDPGRRQGRQITGTFKADEVSGNFIGGGAKLTEAALAGEGELRGEAEIKKATGGRAFGLEIGEGAPERDEDVSDVAETETSS